MVVTYAEASGLIQRDYGFQPGAGTDGEVPDSGLLRDRTVLPSTHQGEETEYSPLAGYYEAERLLREGVDIITGGFPCQDISTAGKGAGIQYDRATGEAATRSGLWGQLARTIRLVRPRFAIMENVAALLSRGMGTVLGDLAEIGYDAEWDCISACDVGAPHKRERIWILAYPAGIRHRRRGESGNVPQADGGQDGQMRPELGGAGQESENMADTESPRLEGRVFGWNIRQAIARPGEDGGAERNGWGFEPDVGRVAHGIPMRVDRIKGLGNAIVPQIPEIIGGAIAE